MEFRFLSEPLATPGEWDEATNWGGIGDIFLFNDRTLTADLSNSNMHSINVLNWEGGKLDISIKWETQYNGEWCPQVTIITPNQPVRPAMPQVYMIGDFNDWKTPTATEDNGARKFQPEFEGYISNIESLWYQLDACDKFRYAICMLDETSGKIKYYAPNNNVPFTLYGLEGDYQFTDVNYNTPTINFEGAWRDELIDQYSIFNLNDWKGGRLLGITYFSLSGEDTRLSWDGVDVPVEKFPKMYVLIDVDGEKSIWEAKANMYDPTCISGGTPDDSHSFSLIFTTENSLNPSPENCYGLPADQDPQNIMNYLNYRHTFSVVKGGKPFSYTFPNMGRMSVNYNPQCSVATMGINVLGSIPYETLYVCGNVMTAPDGVANNFMGPPAANQQFYDDYFRLENCGDTFEGTYYLPQKMTDQTFPDNLPQFRFFRELMGWSPIASYGSAQQDFFCLPVEMGNGAAIRELVPQGLGNFGPCLGESWTGNWVKMTVYRATGNLKLEIVGSGIDDLAVDSYEDATESWYNLQGIKVDRPEKGLYIHIANGRSRLELIK